MGSPNANLPLHGGREHLVTDFIENILKIYFIGIDSGRGRFPRLRVLCVYSVPVGVDHDHVSGHRVGDIFCLAIRRLSSCSSETAL